jgi:cobalt-zinc-cadmium efflux system outer membrane protein
VLTLEQALARAGERSPLLATAESRREVAAARLRQARAWENPTLAIDVENVLGRGEYADFDAAETTVSLSQPLPLGGGRAAGRRGARAAAQLAAVEAELAAREVRREVAIAYAEAIAADRIAAIERERARIGIETREAVEKRFGSGLESELQRSRVAVETSGLQAAARRAAAGSQARRRELAALWRDETVSEALDESWFDAAPIAIAAPGAPVHPRLERSRLAVEQARAALEAQRGARFGGLEATVGTRRFADAPQDSDRAWVLGVSMPLPLWDRNGAAIAEARAELVAAEIEAERAARSLEAEREAAVAEHEAAHIELDALVTSGLPAASAAVRLAQQGYEAGRLSLLERLDAERALSDVRERLVAARLQLRRAETQLDGLR